MGTADRGDWLSEADELPPLRWPLYVAAVLVVAALAVLL